MSRFSLATGRAFPRGPAGAAFPVSPTVRERPLGLARPRMSDKKHYAGSRAGLGHAAPIHPRGPSSGFATTNLFLSRRARGLPGSATPAAPAARRPNLMTRIMRRSRAALGF
jgi:hypothetical protein